MFCIMRVCDNCRSDKTYINKRGGYHWYKHDDKWYCEKCNNKLFKNPKWKPITVPRQMYFKTRQIYLKENPRTGICCLCGAVSGIDCGRTSIHHILYHDEDPLRHTIELCNSCHRMTHWRTNKF